MHDKTVGGVHWSFWAIGAVALIWNVMGIMNFFWQMNADTLAAMPELHRSIAEGRPAWATGAFAIAIFGGALGCLLLLLRKSAAFYLFIASIIPSFGMTGSPIDFRFFDVLLTILMPLAVAVFLIWYS